MLILSCPCQLFCLFCSIYIYSCLVVKCVLKVFQPDGFTVVPRHHSMDSNVFLLPSVLWGYKPRHDGVTLGLIMVHVSVTVFNTLCLLDCYTRLVLQHLKIGPRITSSVHRQKSTQLYKTQPMVSTMEALGSKLEQHTQISWTAQLNCDMHATVGRWRWG